MKPILYAHDETSFTSAGLAILSDCISCTVEEELNGTYECTFEYPITGRHYDLIQEGLIIGATHDDSGQLQPFEIYKRSAPLEGTVEFNAHHISYRLSKTVAMPFAGTSLINTLNELNNNIVGDCPFVFEYMGEDVTGGYKNLKPDTVRSVLLGGDKPLVNAYNGLEIEYDRFSVFFRERRGVDTNVEVRYGKNLTEMVQEIDTSDTYNAIVPYWKSNSDKSVLTLPERYVAHDYDAELTAIPIDLTDKFEKKPLVERLRVVARDVLNKSKGWLPAETIEVSFAALWQTEEYENYAELQRVHLGDGVNVYYPALGVAVSGQRVVRTVYNTLMDRFDEITLGQLQDSLMSLTDQKVTAEITAAIGEAASLSMSSIQGDAGGYIAIPFNSGNQPQKLYVLDHPSLDSAVNVIRFDESGMMHSSNGIDGTYKTLISIDGAIAGTGLHKESGSVTLNSSGVGTITSLVTSGRVPVFGYIENTEAFVTFARDASGDFKIKCTNASGAAITGSKTITIYSKK